MPDRLNNSLEEDCEEARSSCPGPCSRHCQAAPAQPCCQENTATLPKSAARPRRQQGPGFRHGVSPAPSCAGAAPWAGLGARALPVTEPSKHRGTGQEPSTGLARARGTGACPASPGNRGHELSRGRQGLPGEHHPAAGQSLEWSHGSLGGFLSLGTEPAHDGNISVNSTGTQGRCCSLPMNNSLSPGCDSHPVPTPRGPQGPIQQHQGPGPSLGMPAAAL